MTGVLLCGNGVKGKLLGNTLVDVLLFFIILVSIVPVLLVLYLGDVSGYLGNLGGKHNGMVWLHKNVDEA